MATEYGFVYVLSNESMPNIYKIGFTLGHPKARMDQLSSATACPTPFELVACFGCENPRDVEAFLHSQLSEFRINSAREFFKVSPSLLIKLIEDNSDQYGDLVNTYGLNDEVGQERINFELKEKEDVVKRFHSQNADPIHWPAARRGLN